MLHRKIVTINKIQPHFDYYYLKHLTVTEIQEHAWTT